MLGTRTTENDEAEAGEVVPLVDVKHTNLKIRMGFVRKVYGILTIQLAVTVLVAARIVHYALLNNDWVRSHEWLLWLSVGMTFTTICAMACCHETCRHFPLNYILLFIFTVFEAVMLGFISSFYSPESLLIATSVTVFIFLGLTIFASLTRTDFSGSGPYLFVFGMALLVFGALFCVLPPLGHAFTVASMCYSCLGVVLFSFYIIFDTQKILGQWGGHQVYISIDEYAFAALNLYMDIINLFVNLLSIMGERRH